MFLCMHCQPEFTRLVFNDSITKSDSFPALALLPVKTIYISCQMDERFNPHLLPGETLLHFSLNLPPSSLSLKLNSTPIVGCFSIEDSPSVRLLASTLRAADLLLTCVCEVNNGNN